MSSLPTPNFQLTEDVHIPGSGTWSSKDLILPKESFVRPLDIHYVPKHVTEDTRNRWFDPEKEVYCYTKLGIHAIRKIYIKQV